MNHSILAMLAMVIVLAPLVAALATIVVRFIFRGHVGILGPITLIFSLVSLIASGIIASGPVDNFPLEFSFLRVAVYVDALSIYFLLLVNLVAFIASWQSISFLRFDAKHNPKHNPLEFHLVFNLFHVTMLVVSMVDNLVTLWIAVELTTVVSTILVRYRRDRQSAEAAWKFMVITTTGIIFALLGTLFLANAITPETSSVLALLGENESMRWSVLATQEIASTLNPNFVTLSFLFILIGYGTKAGLAPMHTWLPDGHGEAPSPVSALLSGVMVKVALYAILRFYIITNLSQGNHEFTSIALLIAGLSSLVLATPFIIKANKFKRILAYHSLEHMGIIVFGIGIGSPIALFGALLHSLNHALTKALMFLVHGYVQDEYAERLYNNQSTAVKEENATASNTALNAVGDQPPGQQVPAMSGEVMTQSMGQDDDIRGVLKSMPVTGFILACGGLALVGIPPFGIFMSKFIITWAAISTSVGPPDVVPRFVMIAMATLFLVTGVLIFGGLVRHLSRLLLGRAPFPSIEPTPATFIRVAPFVVLLLAMFIFGFLIPSWPVDIPGLIDESVKILQNGPTR